MKYLLSTPFDNNIDSLSQYIYQQGFSWSTNHICSLIPKLDHLLNQTLAEVFALYLIISLIPLFLFELYINMNIHLYSLESFLTNVDSLPKSNFTYFNIDLTRLSSANRWLEHLSSCFDSSAHKYTFSSSIKSYFADIVSHKLQVCLLSGECLALKYRWSNQEYKILPIWSNQYLIDSKPYWFDYYPFLKRTNNHINSNFQQYHLFNFFNYHKF